MIPTGPQSVKFPDELITTPIFGRADYVRFLAPFHFDSDIVGRVTAEKGFDSDGASIPLLIRPIINPGGGLRWASAPHDVLYHYGAVSCEPGARPVTQKEADKVIREAMEACGSNGLMIDTVYRALRLCGWVAWNRARKAREHELNGGVYTPVAPTFVRKKWKKQ